MYLERVDVSSILKIHGQVLSLFFIINLFYLMGELFVIRNLVEPLSCCAVTDWQAHCAWVGGGAAEPRGASGPPAGCTVGVQLSSVAT